MSRFPKSETAKNTRQWQCAKSKAPYRPTPEVQASLQEPSGILAFSRVPKCDGECADPLRFLLLQSRARPEDWVLPKGGKKLPQELDWCAAAERGHAEQTGQNVPVCFADAGEFRPLLKYGCADGALAGQAKTMHVFLGEWPQELVEGVRLKRSHRAYKWLSLRDAIAQTAPDHGELRELLLQAHAFLTTRLDQFEAVGLAQIVVPDPDPEPARASSARPDVEGAVHPVEEFERQADDVAEILAGLGLDDLVNLPPSARSDGGFRSG
jgi:hypothetical protein